MRTSCRRCGSGGDCVGWDLDLELRAELEADGFVGVRLGSVGTHVSEARHGAPFVVESKNASSR